MAVLATISGRSAAELTVEAHDWTAWPQLATTWSSLFEECDRPTFFLAPESIETWLEVFGEQLRPELLLFKALHGEVTGACILVRRTERKGPFFVRRVYLNTAGEDEGDSACIEYNQLLCKAGHEPSMARALRAYLVDQGGERPWDEIHAPGMVDGPSLDALRTVLSDNRQVDDIKSSYYVDLQDVRTSGKEFIEKLASRERTKIRQNIRKYSDLGELELVRAESAIEALKYLDGLAALHQETWTSRGRPGAFASKTFCDYHRRLITRCFPLGRIELLHLRAGNSTVGYHYNFRFGGRSYFYQCGYDYALGAKASPGVTVHALAIRRALEDGLVDYEFMAGDVEYKRRLATHSHQMHWMTWQAPTLKMRSLELARVAKRALRDGGKDLGSRLRNSFRNTVTRRVQE